MKAWSDSPCNSLATVVTRVVLDSWVVSQIWLDSDSNESSQSWVSYENQGYESSQSWVTLIVIWVRVESTGYCLSQSCITDFSEEKTFKIWHLLVALQGKNQPTATFDRTPPPPPGQQILAKLCKMWRVVSQIWLSSDSNELSRSWVRLANFEFELSRSWVNKKVKCWVESELNHLDCHMSQSRVSPKNLSRAQPWS